MNYKLSIKSYGKKLLHIGLPKCGSTFLRKKFLNIKELNISKFTEKD